MTKSSKIVFFGNERLSTGFVPEGAPTLELLLRNGYNVVAIVANFEQGMSRKSRQLEIANVAQTHNIPLLLPKKPQDIANELRAFQAEVGILVAYGKIIPQAIIDIFPRGIINIHPSLLPQYRGSTPIEQAMLDGTEQTGVSIMQLTKAMDAGPIYAQAKIDLAGTETKQALTTTLLKKGGELLIKHLPHILNDSLAPTTQDESKATYTRLLTKEDGNLDPTTKTAYQLEREIRAFASWPKGRLMLFEQPIIVTAARIAVTINDGALVIACANNTYLEITKLTAPSGRSMTGADFMRGYYKK